MKIRKVSAWDGDEKSLTKKINKINFFILGKNLVSEPPHEM